MSEMPEPAIAPRHFRDVLGHLPTGVCIITAIDEDGVPVGMTVGSLTSASLDPPLVAFFADRTSTSFPKIRRATSFCVNVLAAAQESTCRAFVARGRDKFSGTRWRPAPSGAPIIEGVVAWVDCVPERIDEAGDHFLCLGRVCALDVEDPGLPLLFFQGGYGAFAMRSVVMGARSGLTEQVVLADHVRHEVEQLATDTKLEAQAFAPFEESFVLVAAAAPTAISAPSRVGIQIPIVAPVGRLFVAWAGKAALEDWYARSPVAIDGPRRAQLDAEIASARRHGWIPALHSDVLDDMWSTINAMIEVGQTPVLARHLMEDAVYLERSSDPADVDETTAGEVQSLLAPVFGPGGDVVLMLTLVGIPRGLSYDRVMTLKDRLLVAAECATKRLGGARPREG